ncbi:MAG: glycosyl hydrolase family 28 protein [Verrucomicrobiota bacterium]
MAAVHGVLGDTIHAQGEVMAYPTPKGIEASPDYQVRANSKNIFVYNTPVFSMATFAFSGEVEVVLDVKRPIKHPVIRPLARGIKPIVEGNTLRFRINRPCNLAVEVDEDLHRPLFLFANAPEANAPKAGDPNVRYFEGGRIHEVGKIELKDHETLYLAGGAVVRGVIRAKNVSGARILGPGILDASTRMNQSKMVDLTRCTNIEINGVIVLGSYGWTVVPRLSEDIHLRNVKILSWRDNDDGFDPDSSRRITVDNCFFRTKDDCIAVKAHDNSGMTGTTSKGDPNLFNVDDVKVMNSIFWSSEWGHALTVGFAIRAPAVRNILFKNCDIIKKEKGPAMSIDNHDLGLVENVRFEDIRVEDGCDKLLAVKVAFSEYSADCPFEYYRNNAARKPPKGEAWLNVQREKRSSKRGRVQNVWFKDIQIAGDRLPESDIRGFSPANEVDTVVFQNVTFQGKVLQSASEANLRIQNATNVRFEK